MARVNAAVVAVVAVIAALPLAACGQSSPRSAAAARPALAPAPLRAAQHGVVIVIAGGCGQALHGSGWVVAPGIVATSADNLAGQSDITVAASPNAEPLAATAIAYDADDDIALLRVGGLRAAPLAIAQTPPAGTVAQSLGYPRGRLSAHAVVMGAATSAQFTTSGRSFTRQIVLFAGVSPAGDSGEPLISAAGKVISMEIGTTLDNNDVAVPAQEIKPQLRDARGPVSTGPCD
jgi:hypothetical protein